MALQRNKPLRRVNPERAARRKAQRDSEGPLDKVTWEEAVHQLDSGLCVVTSRRIERRSYCYHHVIPKNRLRSDKRFEIVWDPRNGICLVYGVHKQWEDRHEGITIADLPERCLEFAEETGYMGYIERMYG